METETNEPGQLAPTSTRRRVIFFALILAVITAAIIRSSITTSLDSFTYDEAYHVGAGVAYVKTGDFRLNPEQPPLTKLWVGAYVSLFGYELSPYRTFSDKEDERDFVEQDAYFHNDPFALQTHARTAMFALNGILILLLALAAWRVFGEIVAVGLTLFLAIDPTVAAHMPVVMTDLPIALTAGIAVLTAAKAFQSWSIMDTIFAALALGLALSAKHSGIIVLIAVALLGTAAALAASRSVPWRTRLRHFALVGGIVIGGMMFLWGLYGFRYNESPGIAEETFNRSLAEKTGDIRSRTFRTALDLSARLHIFPRAYLWGMADTIRAGVEGRAIQVRAFGEEYYAKAPFYFFPGVVAAKLPIGLLLLTVAGMILLIWRRTTSESTVGIAAYIIFALVFLGFLIRGSSYAGVRHALPLIPFAGVFAAFAIYYALKSSSLIAKGAVALLLVAAIVSAVPQMRPWEYFNELAGGAEHGYLYFNDEGVDLSQRVGEAARFYHDELEPNGDVPFFSYFSNSNDRKARGMDYVGRDPDRDDRRFEGENVTGTFMIGANELGEGQWWDVGKPFRGTPPVKRFGNIFVFQGTFDRPNSMRSRSIFYRTIYSKIYTDRPDPKAAIDGIERSIALDPSCFFAHLELGNQYLKVGDKQNALRAYRNSLERAPRSDSIYDLIAEQVNKLESGPDGAVDLLRNPGIE
jgi:tetratricopeptide (TPR) repeat protein